MARLNKRRKKKQQKKLLQQNVKALKKLDDKKVKKLSYDDLQIITRNEEKRKQKAQKQKQYKLNTRNKKMKYLESMGFDLWGMRVKDIDKIKIKDINDNNVNSKTYPELFEKYEHKKESKLDTFDFDKKYTIKDNERLMIAWIDYQCETNFADLLHEFDGMSDKELIEKLHQVNNLKPLSKGSNGRAASFKFEVGTQKELDKHKLFMRNQKRRKKLKQHDGDFKGYQVLKSGAYNSFDKVTPHKLLVVANAIMNNIQQDEREVFYRRFKQFISKNIPDMIDLIP